MKTLSSPNKASSKTITTHSRVMLSLLMFTAVKAATSTTLKPTQHCVRYRQAQNPPDFILREIQHLTPRACPHKDTKLCILSWSQPHGPAKNQQSPRAAPCASRQSPTCLTPASHFNAISFTSERGEMALPKFHWNLFRS